MTTKTSIHTAPAPISKGPRIVVEYGERFGLVALLVVVTAFFAILPASGGVFTSPENASIVLASQSVVMLVAVSALLPLIAGHFDFSVGAVTAFTSVLCATFQTRLHWPLVVVMLFVVVIGGAIGLLNGVLVARFGLNSFVSTLGVATLLGGVIQWFTGGLAIVGVDPALTSFGSTRLVGIPQVVFVVIAVVAVVWYLLTQTPFGRALYAIGSNARSATLVGLPRLRYTVLAFVLSGTLAGIAGVVLTARTGGANPDDGTSLLFPALAAVFLGATAINPGRFNVMGTVVGLLFVSVGVSGLTLAGAQNWVSSVFNGIALVVAVFLSSYVRRRREGRDA
jgi:ribose transport system permease protein